MISRGGREPSGNDRADTGLRGDGDSSAGLADDAVDTGETETATLDEGLSSMCY